MRFPVLTAALAVMVMACDDPLSSPVPQPNPRSAVFAVPIAGMMNQDWYVTNYVDADGGPGISDYQCGPKSYDGHKGTDLVLPDFARMDEGVDVVAAASGTVIGVHDGEYDRNKSWQDDVTWNVVVVDHGEAGGYRYAAYYGHLRNGSVAVVPGQSVSAGTILGQVGSSGRSDMPHLHFEVIRTPASGGTGEMVDPWEGPCGGTSSLWLDQLPYQDAFRVIQSGITVDPMSLDRVKDPPTAVTAVTGGGSGAISAWVQLHNQRSGAVTSWRWRRPDGGTYSLPSRTHTTFYSMSWWWSSVPLSELDEPGTWSVQIESHGETVATLSFDVTLSGAAVAGDRVPTVAGGGIR